VKHKKLAIFNPTVALRNQNTLFVASCQHLKAQETQAMRHKALALSTKP
jgi:hypothetical protein